MRRGSVRHGLPAGPLAPAIVQTLGAWSRPTAYLERCRGRYGPRFTQRPFGQPPFVILSKPDDLRELFQAPAETLHAGKGARVLEWILGPTSVILLDEDAHLEQRRLLLAAFHTKNMEQLAGAIAELVDREVASWPCGVAVELHPRLQALTLEIVLRAVLGLEGGAERDRVRAQLLATLALSESPLSLIPLPRSGWLAEHGPLGRSTRHQRAMDATIYELIEQRRAAPGAGRDVLGMLLASSHSDGSALSVGEIRDELVTALVAGHETSASQLAWAFVLLARAPAAVARLQAELDCGSSERYLTATIQEVLRRRPVLPYAGPRLVMRPFTLGGVEYPPGVVLVACPYLAHHDPDSFPEPYAFRPERFLGEQPDTCRWIPFGGGRRRCAGAGFAMHEMKLVLRSVLSRFDLTPAGGRAEVAQRRSITICPSRGATVVLSARG